MNPIKIEPKIRALELMLGDEKFDHRCVMPVPTSVEEPVTIVERRVLSEDGKCIIEGPQKHNLS